MNRSSLPPPEDDDTLDLEELGRRVEAEEFLSLGEERHAAGDIEDAAAYYQTSVELFGTAEGYTRLGGALAARGEWQAAVNACREAIALDPDLGNPYNDIGVYLEKISQTAPTQGERRALVEEALLYFDKALAAPRYDCRHFPHYHRGRIHEQRGRFTEARDDFARATELEPDWEVARAAWRRVLGWLN